MRCRQQNSNFAAFAYGAADLNPPAVRFHDCFDQTQAQSQAHFRATSIGPIKPFPDAGQIGLCVVRCVVVHSQRQTSHLRSVRNLSNPPRAGRARISLAEKMSDNGGNTDNPLRLGFLAIGITVSLMTVFPLRFSFRLHPEETAANGKTITNSVEWESECRRVTSPPWARAISRAMLNPSPCPVVSLLCERSPRKKRSNIRS